MLPNASFLSLFPCLPLSFPGCLCFWGWLFVCDSEIRWGALTREWTKLFLPTTHLLLSKVCEKGSQIEIHSLLSSRATQASLHNFFRYVFSLGSNPRPLCCWHNALPSELREWKKWIIAIFNKLCCGPWAFQSWVDLFEGHYPQNIFCLLISVSFPIESICCPTFANTIILIYLTSVISHTARQFCLSWCMFVSLTLKYLSIIMLLF